MFYIDQRCGSWQVGDDPAGGEVEFRVFFPPGPDPHVTQIQVGGSYQSKLGGKDWDFGSGVALAQSPDPSGVFWTGTTGGALPPGFYQYKYLVTFTDGSTRYVSDPCARYGGFTNENAAIAVGGSRPQDNVVRPLAHGRKPLDELNVYELMIDDFTSGYRVARAPMDAVLDRLDYLVQLGFNAILFMPWTAWKSDSFDWGYEPFQYFAIEPRYAHDLVVPQEKLSFLAALISECHDRDIHVIMDGVFNHTSTDFPYRHLYLNRDDSPYTAQPFGGSFPGLQDLDFNNACTQEFIRDACLYWIDRFGIDGIRFDNTVNYYVPGDPRGLPELLQDIRAWINQRGEQNFSMTLEHIDISAATLTNNTNATSFWDNSLYGLTFGYLWDGQIDQRLLNALNDRRFLTAGKVPTLYLSNHDHADVAWQAGAQNDQGSVGAWFKTQPYAIALFTSTATPMVANGQEFGQDRFLPENDQGTGRRVLPRALQWKLSEDTIGSRLLALYGALATMRLDHPALRSANIYPSPWDEWQTTFNPSGVGIDVARQLAIYHRWAALGNGTFETIVVVLNFSDIDQLVNVPFPIDGQWTDLLAGFVGSWSATVGGGRLDVTVGSHWGRVLRKD